MLGVCVTVSPCFCNCISIVEEAPKGSVLSYRVDLYIDAKNGKQFPYGSTNSSLQTQHTGAGTEPYSIHSAPKPPLTWQAARRKAVFTPNPVPVVVSRPKG